MHMWLHAKLAQKILNGIYLVCVLVDAEDGANNCDVGTRRITRPEKKKLKNRETPNIKNYNS